MSYSVHGVKSDNSAISKVALLTPCMEVDIYCGQIPSFEVLWMCHYKTFSIMCLSFFQIQNLCQFWAKRWFSQKDIHAAFPFLFPSVLLTCWHHLKANFGMYFAQLYFCIFEWCGLQIFVQFSYKTRTLVLAPTLLVCLHNVFSFSY